MGNESLNVVKDVMKLSEKMIQLSTDKEMEQVDDDAVLLLCVVRDCAYRIKNSADQTKDRLVREGMWEENGR